MDTSVISKMPVLTRDLLLDVLVYKPYTIYISFAKSTGATPGFQVLIFLLKLLRDTNFFKV